MLEFKYDKTYFKMSEESVFFLLFSEPHVSHDLVYCCLIVIVMAFDSILHG